MLRIACSECHQLYPEKGIPYRCPICGGIFDWEGFPEYDRTKVDTNLPGIWRFQHTFGLPPDTPKVSLGEGNTPLIDSSIAGCKVAWKLEYLNPTGSYKDRGSAVLLSFIKNRGAESAVEDSSGNAGASFAAYAARAGIKAKIFVPHSAAGPKRVQIEAYGAELVVIEGPRSAAAEAVKQEADKGAVYASHAFLPVGMLGNACIAFEIASQLRANPGTVIAPVGHGSLMLGVIRGFLTLLRAGAIESMPVLIGVQAQACAPVWASFENLVGMVEEGQTLAEGVRVRNPVRGKALLAEFVGKQNRIIAVPEDKILQGRDRLAKMGLYVEPTSAIVWEALMQVKGTVPEPIVVLLTGSGFKYLG
jgi:threonine synthase